MDIEDYKELMNNTNKQIDDLQKKKEEAQEKLSLYLTGCKMFVTPDGLLRVSEPIMGDDFGQTITLCGIEDVDIIKEWLNQVFPEKS